MAFDFYFTGVSANSEVADFILKNNICVLLSQLNERNNIYKWIDRIEKEGSKCKLFIDSGAFSAWTRGVSIDIDEYITFINKYSKYITVCASVDNIPGQARTAHVASEQEVNDSAKKTWDNFIYMRARIENPDILLCTFHCGESWDILKNMLSYKDEKGPIKYLAFGGLVGKSELVIKSFLETAFKIIKESDNPNIKVHAFGMTRLNYLEQYPFTSADSTAWLQHAAFGSIVVGKTAVYLSDKGILNNDNIINKNIAIQQEVERLAKKYGFTIDELAKDSNKRLLFNVKSCQDWANNYKPVISSAFKYELW